MMKNMETNHEIDEVENENCLDICNDLIADLEAGKYPEHMIELAKGLAGEIEEYEGGEDGDKTVYEAGDVDGDEDGKNPDQQINDNEDELTNFVKGEVSKKK